MAYVNGFNLGWYWPSIGPQNHYYVPGPLLKEGLNEVVLVEVEKAADVLSGKIRVKWPALLSAVRQTLLSIDISIVF